MREDTNPNEFFQSLDAAVAAWQKEKREKDDAAGKKRNQKISAKIMGPHSPFVRWPRRWRKGS